MDQTAAATKDWTWLPRAMPGVAQLMGERRRDYGAAHVAECWRRGMAGEPGWFYAREGPIAIGTPWTAELDAVLAAATAWQLTATQTAVFMRKPEGHVAPASIGEKVDYVKAAAQTRDHGCHWPGCGKQVKPAMWGCSDHWYRLPKPIRNRIWQSYRVGQEEGDAPVTREYLDAAQEAQAWIREQGNGTHS